MKTKPQKSQSSSPTRSRWCKRTQRLGGGVARSKELRLSRSKTLFVLKQRSAFFRGQAFQRRPCQKRPMGDSSKRIRSCSPLVAVICVNHVCALIFLRWNGRSTCSATSMDASFLLCVANVRSGLASTQQCCNFHAKAGRSCTSNPEATLSPRRRSVNL